MSGDLIYVYCVINGPPGLIGSVNSKGIKSFVFGQFTVFGKAVKEIEFSEENFKKNLSDLQWLDINAREHIRVISEIMKFATVIPFNFGTIYQSESNLQKFILNYEDSLLENFAHLKEKEEWSVKIYADTKVLKMQIDELSEKAAALEREIMASSPGKAFLLSRKKTELIENEIDRLCKHYGQNYYDEFKNLSVVTSLNNLLPKDFTGREDTMILNANFLVSQSKSAEFVNQIESSTKESANHGFVIEARGPWPTFSFISIKEK
ncbi:MAG: GvpL/GvpF family gas vesicle protein [Bacteroidales bacterium]|nr:GvpL/GvpF family gas vesicle protein [Bacteroidales bacterium]